MSTTDIATETVALCRRLLTESTEAGGIVLSKYFNVPPGSTEFYMILSSINSRIDALREMLPDLGISEGLIGSARTHLDRVQAAFSFGGLQNSWSNSVKKHLRPESLTALEFLSTSVNSKQPLPFIGKEDTKHLLENAESLLAFMDEHEFPKFEYFKPVIIAGLKSYVFRLKHFEWVGVEFVLDEFRQLMPVAI